MKVIFKLLRSHVTLCLCYCSFNQVTWIVQRESESAVTCVDVTLCAKVLNLNGLTKCDEHTDSFHSDR